MAVSNGIKVTFPREWSLHESPGRLEAHERKEFERLLRDHEQGLSQDGNQLGQTSLIQHSIDTGNTQTIKQAPRRFPVHRQAALM